MTLQEPIVAPAADPVSPLAPALPATPKKRKRSRRESWTTHDGQVIHAPHQTWRTALRKDWRLYSFLVLPLIFLAVFRYWPILGNVVAFRRFRPGGSMFGDEWVGLYTSRCSSTTSSSGTRSPTR